MTGCGSAWLERLVWDQEVAGSSPVARSFLFLGSKKAVLDIKSSTASDCRQSPAFAGFCYCWNRFSDIINIRRAVFFYDDEKCR